MYSAKPPTTFDTEALRLEGVIACVGFDDILDVTLGLNHQHFDTLIVVTSHADRQTQLVARKHGTMCVQTDLFQKNGRNFNKGAALNVGFDRFQYHGWRQVLDADLIVPDNYRRLLFNHTHLDRSCIYGADRVDVIFPKGELAKLQTHPQHMHRCLVESHLNKRHGARYVDPLRGYVPIGFFQLWHASAQKSYPCSLGSAAHDDIQFAAEWPVNNRRLLPTVICYHLCAQPPQWGENWEGHRRQPRLHGG